jgi:hypothetical protein
MLTDDEMEALEALEAVEALETLSLTGDAIASSIWQDNEITDLIQDNLFDPWKNTPFKDYVYLDNTAKGQVGELFVTKYMKAKKYKVDKTNKNNGPYDRYISSSNIESMQSSANYMIPTEIKFSLAYKNPKTKGIKKNIFIINHIALGKAWERLIFVCINGENPEDWLINWFKKTDFEHYLENDNKLFRRQQGGEDGGNDDWICSPPNSFKLISEPWVHDISSW